MTGQASREPWRVPRVLWLIAPVVLLLGGLLVAPLALLFSYSFFRFLGSARFEETFSLANYARVLTDPFFLRVLFDTLALGVMVTLITLVLGYPVALAIVRSRGLRGSLITALVAVPLVTSAVVRTYSWLTLLAPNGLVNRTLIGAGVIDRPLRLLFDGTGVTIGLVHVLLPFMILAVASSLRNVDPALEEAARSLGAGPLRTFWRVTFRLSLPGVIAGSLLVFVLTISAFVTPALLGGERVKVMATLVYEQAVTVVNWPLAATLSVVLLVVALGLIAASLALAGREARWREEAR